MGIIYSTPLPVASAMGIGPSSAELDTSSSQMKLIWKPDSKPKVPRHDPPPTELMTSKHRTPKHEAPPAELVVSIPLILLRPATPTAMVEEELSHGHKHKHHKIKKHKKHKKHSQALGHDDKGGVADVSHTPNPIPISQATPEQEVATPLSGKHLSFSQVQSSPFKFTISKYSHEESPLQSGSSSFSGTEVEKKGHTHKHKKHHHHHSQSSFVHTAHSAKAIRSTSETGLSSALGPTPPGIVRGVAGTPPGMMRGVAGGGKPYAMFSSPDELLGSEDTSHSYTRESHDSSSSQQEEMQSHDTGLQSHDQGLQSRDQGPQSRDQGPQSHDPGLQSHDPGLQSHDPGSGKSHKKKKKKHKHSHLIAPSSLPTPPPLPSLEDSSPPVTQSHRKRSRTSESGDIFPPAKRFQQTEPLPTKGSIGLTTKQEPVLSPDQFTPPTTTRLPVQPGAVPRPATPPRVTPPQAVQGMMMCVCACVCELFYF